MTLLNFIYRIINAVLIFWGKGSMFTDCIKENTMDKYICTVCNYEYDPEENGGIKFEDLPDDYVCPLCGVGKDMFEKV